MRAFRSIIHILLVLAILATGLPLYDSADVNRDGKVGLTDAIVSIRQLVDRAAADRAAFRDGMESTLNSLSVAAGLKTTIRTGRDPGQQAGGFAMPVLMTASDYQFGAFPPAALCAADRSLPYNSPALMPLDPPPNADLA